MIIFRVITVLPLTFCLLFTASCEKGTMNYKPIPVTPVTEVRESAWKRLSEKKIYFGHMSVGFNIVEGLKDVMKENPQIKLRIVETNDTTMFGMPIFAHSRNGKNHDPESKIDAFAESMERGIGNNVDIAFFKFCFVDITANTDVQKEFKYYKEKMEKLKGHYPQTIFIHVTVPVTTVQSGLKAWLKTLLDRPVDGYAQNIRRNEFNDLLRQEYEGKAPLFDLGKIESFLEDGQSVTFAEGGKSFYAMNPAFTNDGGHLNPTGRKFVAQSLLILLAQLSEQIH